MNWHLPVWQWLAHAALGGLVLLALGSLAVRLCREPVHRLRLAALTLWGCLLVPWLALVPGWPRWGVDWMTSAAPPAVTAEAAPTTPSASGPAPLPVDVRPRREAVAEDAAPAEKAPAPVTAAPPAPVAEEPVRAPAPAAAGPGLPLTLVLVAVYLAGAVFVALRWLVGLRRLRLLVAEARPADPETVALFRGVAGPAGEHIRLLVSDRVELPLMYCWWRPVIVLPARLPDSASLRFCLAHELSHAVRGDAWRWHLAALVQVLYFYLPFYWWLRRQVRLCQDYLADARAAAEAAEAEDYAEFLVGLSRQSHGPAPAGALGMADRRSNLYRRVVMLIDRERPLQTRCRLLWSAAAIAVCLLALGAVSAFRLDAAVPGKDDKKEDKKEDKPAVTGETLKYGGFVVCKKTGLPLPGATVTVRRSVSNRDYKVVEETKHTTNFLGRYAFTIPPEQVAERFLYIELDVEHPLYAPQRNFGYSMAMILKNEKIGGRPFFELVRLSPAKPVTGRIETPDGKPAAKVPVLGYSRSGAQRRPGEFEYGSFDRAITDAQGRFKLNLITPGQGIVWVLPDDHIPTTHVVRDKRGDLGRFVLTEGPRIKGKALDARGKPVAGIYVNVERKDRPDDPLFEFVGDSVRRGAQTNDKGEFEMAPLPSGTYELTASEHLNSTRGERSPRRTPPAVFLRHKVTVKEGEKPEPVTFQAVPHVVFEGQYLDSKGKPTAGHECFLFGQIDNQPWFSQGRPDDQGKIRALLPHGLEGLQVNLITNEHGVLRHRTAPGEPLKSGRTARLGTVNADVKGFEIVRYVAPIVLVKVKTADGGAPKELRLSADYKPGTNREGKFILKSGVHSDVNFELQSDGRFRSSQLLPDEEITVKAEADGYQPATAQVKLSEGETKDVVLTLEKK